MSAHDMLPSLLHLDDGFALWPIAELRSAGFTHEILAPLTDAPLAALARERALVVDEARVLRRRLVAALLDARRQADDEDRRAALAAMKRAVERGSSPEIDDPDLAEVARALDVLRERLSALEAAMDERLESAMARAAAHLVDVAQDERFRRAVLWQNKGALRGTLDALVRHARGGAVRTKELALVVAYLTRYATKNDTVGFTGPVGWARLVDDTCAVLSTPGQSLIRRFDVRLEPWAMAALADALGAKVRRHLAPSLSPRVLIENGCVTGVPSRRLDGREPLGDDECALLDRVDGRTTVGELTRDPRAAAALESLMKKRVVRARLPVDVSVHPERVLERALAALPDDDDDVIAAREDIGRVLAARDRVVAQRDDATSLEGALDALDAAFAKATGGPSVRNAGRVYGSRTLTYANATRDVDVRVGRAVLDQMARPLALLCRVARAFSVDVARRFLTILDDHTSGIARRRREPRVPALLVYERLVALFKDPPPDFLRAARVDIEARVRELFGAIDEKSREVRLSTTELAPRLDVLFPERAPGFRGAQHHSPDVLFERRADGTTRVVLGEIHVGTNTLAVQQAVDQSDDPALLRALFRRDLPPPLFVELQHEDFGLCAHDALIGADDVHVDTGTRFSSCLDGERVIPLSALWLAREGAHLSVYDDEGFFVCDALELFERVLRLNATTEFHLPVARPHQPRVLIDDMVVQRETWTLTRDELAPLVAASGRGRVVEMARLASRHAWPRHLFVRVPHEKKPLYLDTESPIVVDHTCRMLGESDRASFSEMLPAPEDTWLSDAHGHRYVSELRLVVFDPAPSARLPVSQESSP